MPIPSSKPGTKIAAARQELEAVLVKLAEARSSYARWEATAVRLRELGRRTLNPLEEQFGVYARQLIRVFDTAYGNGTLTEPERTSIAETICVLADRMLSTNDDSEIRQFYNRYSGSDYRADRARFLPVLREVGDLLLADTYPVSCSFDEEGDQAEAEELHAKLVGIILTLPQEQQAYLLEQANAGYINEDPIALRVLDIELDLTRRPGTARLGVRQISRKVEFIEDYLEDLEFDTVGIQFSLMVQLNLPGSPPFTESIAQHCVRLQKHLLEHQLENIACDVADFRDMAKLKAWLKEKQQNKDEAAPVQH
jgi:hypothetical protein